jgi:hypothetical protein
MPEDCVRQLVEPHVGGRRFRQSSELQVNGGAHVG